MSEQAKQKTLTKREIAKRVSMAQDTITNAAALKIVSFIFDIIGEELLAGTAVQIQDLATIKLVARKARKARNPRTGEEVDVPAKRALKINPIGRMGQALKSGD